MPDRIQVLSVADEPEAPDLRGVADSDDEFDVRRATTAREAIDRLADERVDCIVSAYRLPERDGLEFLEAVRDRRPDLPFVLVTDHGSEAVAIEAISLGVTDYLRPADEPALASRITDAVSEYRSRQRRCEDGNLLDAIFDQIPIHLFVKDTAGRHVRVSTHLTDEIEHGDDTLTVDSFTRAEILGKTDVEIADGEHERAAYADDMHVVDTGDPILSKEEYSPFADEWNLTSKVPWYGTNGEIQGIIGVSHRITERKRYQQELERQNERLDEFTSIASHDLRNPLNVAQGHLERVRADGDDESLDIVADSLDRMETLIENLLTIAREGEAVTEFETVPIAELVESCWRTVATGTADLAVETDAVVRADRQRLMQVVENLLRNSVEHGSTNPRSQAHEDAGRRSASSEPSVATAPEDAVEHGSTSSQCGSRADDAVEHGTTTARSRPREETAADEGDGVTITVGAIDDGVGFYVADDGDGIPEDERERILKRGYSTSPDGTGFGLSIVAQIAAAHGWTVTVTESTAGGARFEFTGVEFADGDEKARYGNR